jgi:hypothetical protein
VALRSPCPGRRFSDAGNEPLLGLTYGRGGTGTGCGATSPSGGGARSRAGPRAPAPARRARSRTSSTFALAAHGEEPEVGEEVTRERPCGAPGKRSYVDSPSG